MEELKFRLPSIDSAVEDLSGGQRQGVAVARSAIFARRLVIMDEPTAAPRRPRVRRSAEPDPDDPGSGLPVILISHNMPHVFELADRIHIMRLGRRVALHNSAAAFDGRSSGHHDRRRAGQRAALAASWRNVCLASR